MIYVTGDKHKVGINELSDQNFPEGRNLTRNDYVVITGDFGLLWNNPPDANELKWLEWLSNKPWTTLVVDGNHENFDLMDNLDEITMFGNPVGIICLNVYHLKRGYVYTINDKKCFVFGGADSTDKQRRIEYISWWPRELPSREETERGFDSLDAVDWNVDYVFTHAAPKEIIEDLEKNYFKDSYVFDRDRFNDPVSKYLSVILEQLKFKYWFFGHYHLDTLMFKVPPNDGYFMGLYSTIFAIYEKEEL